MYARQTFYNLKYFSAFFLLCVCLCEYMYVCLRVYMHMHLCVYMCVCVHMYVYMYVHVYVCTCMHVFMCAHICMCVGQRTMA